MVATNEFHGLGKRYYPGWPGYDWDNYFAAVDREARKEFKREGIRAELKELKDQVLSA